MGTRTKALVTGWATLALAAAYAPAALAQDTVTLSLAHSYSATQPQALCGAQVIADDVAEADVGLAIELFGDSQLGGDADRIASVIDGSIDMDIQGASALSSAYEPMGTVDGAFVFDDAEHLKRFFKDAASEPLRNGFLEATGVRVLGAWAAGARQFTANKAIREPADLEGLRMRFPPSPQFLMNAAAMGATPVEVAYEELYLALQQGIADGQENPVVNIVAKALDEVQSVISLSSHQLSSNVVVMNEAKWESLNEDQQAALQTAVEHAMDRVPECDAEATETQLDLWRENGAMEVVDDVDREAFRAKAEPYLRENFTPDQVVVLDAIRSVADSAE